MNLEKEEREILITYLPDMCTLDYFSNTGTKIILNYLFTTTRGFIFLNDCSILCWNWSFCCSVRQIPCGNTHNPLFSQPIKIIPPLLLFNEEQANEIILFCSFFSSLKSPPSMISGYWKEVIGSYREQPEKYVWEQERHWWSWTAYPLSDCSKNSLILN